MSSAKPNIEGVVQETEDFLRKQLRIAKEFVEATEQYLERIAKITGQPGENDVNLFGLDLRNVSPPFNAIKLLLQHVQRPLSRHQIVRALVAKGARLGAKQGKSVNQSISANVRIKKLKEPKFDPDSRKQDPSNLVGLPDWKDELFKP
jgi:hypothetical protein